MTVHAKDVDETTALVAAKSYLNVQKKRFAEDSLYGSVTVELCFEDGKLTFVNKNAKTTDRVTEPKS